MNSLSATEYERCLPWPPKCEVLVLLAEPFLGTYPASSEVQYREINDSHYWKAEFRFNEGAQLLCCGFGAGGA